MTRSTLTHASPSQIESLLEAIIEAKRERPRANDDDTPRTRILLGETLIARGLVSLEELERALAIQRESGQRVGEILVELGAISAADLTAVLAEHLNVPCVDLTVTPPDRVLASLIPEAFARRCRVVAVERNVAGVVVAMANPKDVFATDDLQMLTGERIIPALADIEQLRQAIDALYRHTEIENTIEDASDQSEGIENLADQDVPMTADVSVHEGPIVRLVNAILEQAVVDRASDVHIEPARTSVIVRQRVDGVLHDTSEAPLSVLRPVIARLKVLAGLDIAQSRIPQDGRFSCTVDGRSIDARVATLPTSAGESAVVRILDPHRDNVNLSSLGLSATERDRLVPHFFAQQGAVFVTGPTGAGKTSTLYAMLHEINSRAKNIVSIEDPVEYRVDGVKQMQVNPRAGVTFATALRSVLRADPDVVLVGEVRDAETAKISASASITGHLVLSTLHTTSAAATPLRLVDMGVEPYLVASALTCVVSQRLARRLCDECAEDAPAADRTLLRNLGAPESVVDDARMRRAVGCPNCRHTGYRGRLPIFEIMPVTDDIRRAVVERRSPADLEAIAVGQGMDTLRVAALRRVARGDMSVDEFLRTVA